MERVEMAGLNMTYFMELRHRVNARLRELGVRHAEHQIHDFPWVYGALGAVPSKVMFICENPSISGVRRANVDTIDGGPPDIEAQWWGGRNNPAAKRFRRVLYEFGLKATPPGERGGWNCYITNVVKEANVAGAEQGALTATERKEQAEEWADLLRWELENVKPRYVFCVGGRAFDAVKHLRAERLLPYFAPRKIGHYSGRGEEEHVLDQMRRPLKEVFGDLV